MKLVWRQKPKPIQSFFLLQNSDALNEILLELRKKLFYNFIAVLRDFKSKIMYLMIKEKKIALIHDSFESFVDKWKQFHDIYDFMGPDCQIMY